MLISVYLPGDFERTPADLADLLGADEDEQDEPWNGGGEDGPVPGPAA